MLLSDMQHQVPGHRNTCSIHPLPGRSGPPPMKTSPHTCVKVWSRPKGLPMAYTCGHNGSVTKQWFSHVPNLTAHAATHIYSCSAKLP